MARPELRLFAPTEVVPGQTVEGELELVLARAAQVDHLHVRLVAAHGWRTGLRVPDAHPPLAPLQRCVLERDVAHAAYEPGALAAGAARFPIRFEVPAGVEPTHDAFGIAFATFALHAHAFGPGFDERFELPLAVRRVAAAVEPAPIVVESHTAVHRLRLGLAASRVNPGGALVGAIAGIAIADDTRRDVAFKLVGRLALGETLVERVVAETTVVLPAGFGGAGVPFVFEVPAGACPTIATSTHAVTWLVRARTAAFFEGPVVVEAPIEIVEPAIAPARTVPVVGTQRVEPVFAAFAQERGWRLAPELDASEPRLGLLMPTITFDTDDRRAAIAFAYRGKHATFFIARLAYRALDLGLCVEPSSGLRELLARDLQAGVTAWDRAYRVTARDQERAEALLRAVVPALPEALGAIVRWTDTEIVCERPVGLVVPGALGDLAAALRKLGAAIEATRERTAPAAGPYR